MKMDRRQLEKVSPFPLGQPNTAYAKYFIGDSYLSMLNSREVAIANVTFAPGCRNNWHVHHGTGQILICVGGHGWYQEFGKPARRLQPGDVVYIPTEVKHWHGAAADEAFAHLALSVPGGTVDWLEPVSDGQYRQLG